jgi:hypothetical protein
MSSVLVPSLQVKAQALIRRRRELPIKGLLRVKVGDQVSEGDIVAEALLPGEMRIVRVAEELGVEADEVEKALRVVEGQAIEQGALLAERQGLFGFFTSRVSAPISGVVELISKETGHIAIRSAPKPLQLNAYLRGTVVETKDDRSLTIESHVDFIQGIFGVGGERQGKIHVLDVAPQQILAEKHLISIKKGDIVVGGCRPSISVLNTLAEIGAVGLIVGSLDDRTLQQYLGFELGIALTGDEQVPLTVIMTEGFGSFAIAEHAGMLLKKSHGCHASINGATQVRAGAIRPEILIFGADSSISDSSSVSAYMKVGVRVRMIRVPYFGMYGEIVELPDLLEEIPSGAKARVVRVKLGDGALITVPRANIELV